MKGGDKLPPLHMALWRENIVFSFNGEYNDQTDNLEFFVEGPVGFIYKGSLQVDPAQEAGDSGSYSWKMKRHAHTREGRDQDSTQFFVPRSVCLAAATTVGSETSVVKRWTFYGRSVPQRFARLGLKLTFSPARCGENPETTQGTTARTKTIRDTVTGLPTGNPTRIPTGTLTGLPTRNQTGLPTGSPTRNLTAQSAPRNIILAEMDSVRESDRLSMKTQKTEETNDDILTNAGLPGGDLQSQSQETEEDDQKAPKFCCFKAQIPGPNAGPHETVIARTSHIIGGGGDPNCIAAIPLDDRRLPKRRITKNFNQPFIYKNVAI